MALRNAQLRCYKDKQIHLENYRYPRWRWRFPFSLGVYCWRCKSPETRHETNCAISSGDRANWTWKFVNIRPIIVYQMSLYQFRYNEQWSVRCWVVKRRDCVFSHLILVCFDVCTSGVEIYYWGKPEPVPPKAFPDVVECDIHAYDGMEIYTVPLLFHTTGKS